MSVSKPTREQLRYWGNVLKQHGLSMEKGNNHKKLVYAGDMNDLDKLQSHSSGDQVTENPSNPGKFGVTRGARRKRAPRT